MSAREEKIELSGKMRPHRIRILPGDRIRVVSRARITCGTR